METTIIKMEKWKIQMENEKYIEEKWKIQKGKVENPNSQGGKCKT